MNKKNIIAKVLSNLRTEAQLSKDRIEIPPVTFRKYLLSDHFLQRMNERKILPREIIEAVKKGNMYQVQPENKVHIFYKNLKLVVSQKNKTFVTIIKNPRFKKYSPKISKGRPYYTLEYLEEVSDIKLT